MANVGARRDLQGAPGPSPNCRQKCSYPHVTSAVKTRRKGMRCPLVCSTEIGPFLINQTLQMGTTDLLGALFLFLNNNDNAFPLLHA